MYFYPLNFYYRIFFWTRWRILIKILHVGLCFDSQRIQLKSSVICHNRKFYRTRRILIKILSVGLCMNSQQIQMKSYLSQQKILLDSRLILRPLEKFTMCYQKNRVQTTNKTRSNQRLIKCIRQWSKYFY